MYDALFLLFYQKQEHKVFHDDREKGGKGIKDEWGINWDQLRMKREKKGNRGENGGKWEERGVK